MSFSCKGRGLCPSCGAKRAAESVAFLVDEVGEDVGHAQWVFTIPKILRVHFLYHRELLGKRPQAAVETAKELLAAAAGEEEGLLPGVVSVVQTFGDRANFHPHVHALVTRGGWTAAGEWLPVPYVDEGVAEGLLRHKVLGLLRGRGQLSEERIELLLSWSRPEDTLTAQAAVLVPEGEATAPLPPERPEIAGLLWLPSRSIA